jgi:hypothetical protein
LLTNVRIGWKGLQETNTLAYWPILKLRRKQSVVSTAPHPWKVFLSKLKLLLFFLMTKTVFRQSNDDFIKLFLSVTEARKAGQVVHISTEWSTLLSNVKLGYYDCQLA